MTGYQRRHTGPNLSNGMIWILGICGIAYIIFKIVSCNHTIKAVAEYEKNEAIQKYDGVTISVDISGKNTLAILLAGDGTINRKGSGVVDTSDNNFFMGITNDKVFDSLMNGISNDLLTHCNTNVSNCDTTQQTCKAEITFGNNNSVCKIEHCVYGTLNDLPKPIKEFIEKAIVVTDTWYKAQKKMIIKK